MKVLVTGSTGFIGSHVVGELLAHGHEVKLLVRNFEKANTFFFKNGITAAEIVVGDITDTRFVDKALVDCDAVVHAAAVTPMQAVSQKEMFRINVDGVKTIIGSACSQCIKNIVYVSSITAIFSPDSPRINADSPVATSQHAYGKSKAEAEVYIRRLQDEGKPVKSVYPGGVIGPDDPGHSATLMALHYRLTKGFKVTSGGIQQMDVRDLARIIVCLLELNDSAAGRFITAGHYMTWDRFALLLEDIIGRPLSRQNLPGWFLRLIGHYYDTKRLFMHVDSPISAETMRYATQWVKIENDAVIKKMGIDLRSPRQTFTDTMLWMVDSGMLKLQDVPGLAASFRET